MDKIEITHVEFAGARLRTIKYMDYAEWTRNGVPAGAWEWQGIPDDVRVALALLVAPGLVVAVPMSVEE